MNEPLLPALRYSGLLQEVERRRQAGARAVGLIIMRLDDLERINQRFGYPGGDIVLDEFARRIAAVAREQDFAAVTGSSTFALIVDSPLNSSHMQLAAERIAKVASEPCLVGESKVSIEVRAGVSLWPDFAENAVELLQQAETALKASRESEQNYCLFEPSESAPEPLDDTPWLDARRALENGEFELFFQPKINLRTGAVFGAEGLIRWRSPNAGLIPPGLFMPAVERSPAIRPLVEFVLNAGLNAAAQWQRFVPGFNVSINMTPTTLLDADIVEHVGESLALWQVDAPNLTLEITEGVLMSNPAAGAIRLRELQDLGVSVSIDDFGTGYSSLAYLKNLAADELKIDQSFVKLMAVDETDRRIVASMIDLGHACNMKIVAEGIEDEPTAQALASMGCDIGQGYFFGRPVPAAEFQAFLKSRATECAVAS
jgi:diguanylate cyclase (GGDEF)-like protein